MIRQGTTTLIKKLEMCEDEVLSSIFILKATKPTAINASIITHWRAVIRAISIFNSNLFRFYLNDYTIKLKKKQYAYTVNCDTHLKKKRECHIIVLTKNGGTRNESLRNPTAIFKRYKVL